MSDANEWTDDQAEWTEEGDEQKPPTATEEIVEERVTERPDGLPSLMPFAVLYSNRKKRAEFFSLAMSPAVQSLQSNGGEADVTDMSVAMQALADMEEALRRVVHPASKAALDKWLREVDDEALMQAYGWYMSQMGEVTASST